VGLSIRRNALAARAIIGLVCIVIGPIRPVAVIAPADVGAAGTINGSWTADRTANDHATGECSQRKPGAVVTTITWSIIAIAAMASIPLRVATPATVSAPIRIAPPMASVLYRLDTAAGHFNG